MQGNTVVVMTEKSSFPTRVRPTTRPTPSLGRLAESLDHQRRNRQELDESSYRQGLHDDTTSLFQFLEHQGQQICPLVLLVMSTTATAMMWRLAMMRLLWMPMGRRLMMPPRTTTATVAPEIHVDPSLVFLSPAAHPHLLAHLFDPWLDLLHVIGRVISLAHNDMQMRSAPLPLSPDPIFKNLLRLVDELPVQVDGVRRDPAGGVILAKDVLGGLPVVVIHLGSVGLPLVGKGLGGAAVAGRVGCSGLFLALGGRVVGFSALWEDWLGTRNGQRKSAYAFEAFVPLSRFVPGQVTEAIVFAFNIVVVVARGVRKGCFWHTTNPS